MKFISGILIGLALGAVMTARAQDVAPSRHDLTIREIIEILADYDFIHSKQQPFFRPAYGVTNFDSDPPAVWIFSTGDTASRRSTVIHELLHVHYHQLGLNPEDDFIASEESRQYLRLFAQ